MREGHCKEKQQMENKTNQKKEKKISPKLSGIMSTNMVVNKRRGLEKGGL